MAACWPICLRRGPLRRPSITPRDTAAADRAERMRGGMGEAEGMDGEAEDNGGRKTGDGEK